jgi:NAD(P)-dependent dehydrogenase (short-subunit alcohol dehydrogenase family)
MGRSRRRPPWTSVPRQDGRTIVVTGATSGLGLQTAKILAAFGAHVVLAVRNPEKGEAVSRDLPGTTEVRRLDVSDLASVRSFAEATQRVDVLVNNAGIMAVPLARTEDGFESQLATNHLGHFALTNLLLPKLTDRVVVVGSAAHRSGRIDLDDPNWERRPYRAYPAYAQSKLANLLFLAELQRRLTAHGSTLRATGAHPGYTSTALQGGTGNRAFTWLSDLGNWLVGMPAWQGALATVYAATMDLPGNSYVGPHGPGEMLGWPTLVGRSPAASDPELGKALWSLSEKLTGTPWPL